MTNGQKTQNLPTKSSPSGSSSNLSSKFDKFLSSLGDVLNDITALEVSTMVVSRISGSKFSPLEAYEVIYHISEATLAEEHVAENSSPEERRKCWDRYLKLRSNLERYYANAVHDPRAKLPDPVRDVEKLEEVFENAEFLRALRKTREQKRAYDSDDPLSTEADLIYAQTVIQLDGDVVNRFHEKLFQSPPEKKELILKVHAEGVATGESQWRGLLTFVVDLLRTVVRPEQPPTSLPMQASHDRQTNGARSN